MWKKHLAKAHKQQQQQQQQQQQRPAASVRWAKPRGAAASASYAGAPTFRDDGRTPRPPSPEPRTVDTTMQKPFRGSVVWVLFAPAVWTVLAFFAFFYLSEQNRAGVLAARSAGGGGGG
jgi:hypothetical protein